MKAFFAHHQHRLTVSKLPSNSTDINPIEFMLKKLKARPTHNLHYDYFTKLIETVDDALAYFANAPDQVLALMGRYCETLGVAA
jgi:hypothetical protein